MGTQQFGDSGQISAHFLPRYIRVRIVRLEYTRVAFESKGNLVRTKEFKQIHTVLIEYAHTLYKQNNKTKNNENMHIVLH